MGEFMRARASLILFAAIIGLCFAQDAHADGVNTDSNTLPLPIGAGGNTVMTITPSSCTAGPPCAYSINSVGISTTTPQATLDVNGEVNIGNRLWADPGGAHTGGDFVLGAQGTSNPAQATYAFLFNADATGTVDYMGFYTSGIRQMYIDSNGNVGIGPGAPVVSLDLSGRTDAISLPKGATSDEPSSPVAGMFRYNTTINMPEYYNGTVWVQVGQASVGPIHGANDACNWPDTLISCGFTCDPGYCLVDFSGQAQVGGGGSSIFGECILASLTAGQNKEKCY